MKKDKRYQTTAIDLEYEKTRLLVAFEFYVDELKHWKLREDKNPGTQDPPWGFEEGGRPDGIFTPFYEDGSINHVAVLSILTNENRHELYLAGYPKDQIYAYTHGI